MPAGAPSWPHSVSDLVELDVAPDFWTVFVSTVVVVQPCLVSTVLLVITCPPSGVCSVVVLVVVVPEPAGAASRAGSPAGAAGSPAGAAGSRVAATAAGGEGGEGASAVEDDRTPHSPSVLVAAGTFSW